MIDPIITGDDTDELVAEDKATESWVDAIVDELAAEVEEVHPDDRRGIAKDFIVQLGRVMSLVDQRDAGGQVVGSVAQMAAFMSLSVMIDNWVKRLDPVQSRTVVSLLKATDKMRHEHYQRMQQQAAGVEPA